LSGGRKDERADPEFTGADFHEINHEFIDSLVGQDTYISPDVITSPLELQKEHVLVEQSDVFQPFYEGHTFTIYDASEHLADLNQGRKLYTRSTVSALILLSFNILYRNQDIGFMSNFSVTRSFSYCRIP
jgi:hypothetical protein